MNAILSCTNCRLQVRYKQEKHPRSCMQRTALNTMVRKRDKFIRCCTGACSLCIAWRRPASLASCMQWNERLHVHVCAATFHCNHSEQSCSTLASKFDSATLLLLGHSCQWPKQRMTSSCTSLEHVLQGAESGQTLVQAPCRHHIAFTWPTTTVTNIHDTCNAMELDGHTARIGKHIDTKARTCLECMRTELDTGHLLPAGAAVTVRARVARRRTLEDAMVCWQTLSVMGPRESLFSHRVFFSLFFTFFAFFHFFTFFVRTWPQPCCSRVAPNRYK
jgi:hypothetical protein